MSDTATTTKRTPIEAFQQKSIEQQTLETLQRMEKLLGEVVDNTRPSGTKAKYAGKGK